MTHGQLLPALTCGALLLQIIRYFIYANETEVIEYIYIYIINAFMQMDCGTLVTCVIVIS